MILKLLCLIVLFFGPLFGCEPLPSAPDKPAPPKCCPQKPVMVAFTASWCGPCHRQAPLVDQIEAAGVRVIRFDIDKNPDKAREYGITAVPTYIYIKCHQTPVRTHQANDILIRIQRG